MGLEHFYHIYGAGLLLSVLVQGWFSFCPGASKDCYETPMAHFIESFILRRCGKQSVVYVNIAEVVWMNCVALPDTGGCHSTAAVFF